MAIKRFPPVEMADQYGLLAIGGDLEVESLLLAYRSGIFPWPLNSEILAWFSPPRRAILFFDEFHISRSLARERRKSRLKFTLDRDFLGVMEGCAKAPNRKYQHGTWITPAMREAYAQLHAAGFAHSVEAYDGTRLVGGVYGVAVGKMFSAESMFYEAPNASKLCLCFLIDHLRSRGAHWLDCQVVTAATTRFGVREIPREQFMEMVRTAIADRAPLF